MTTFLVTTHLSEITEESYKNPVIIFIHSSECGQSSEVEKILKKTIEEHVFTDPIYKVTVQTYPALSAKIEEYTGITHESPQIIILNQAKVTYTAHHQEINPHNFIFK